MSAESDSLGRLLHVFGRARGQELHDEILEEIGLTELRGPDDEMRFADALIARQGLMEAIGRALRVRALLRGGGSARSSSSPSSIAPPAR